MTTSERKAANRAAHETIEALKTAGRWPSNARLSGKLEADIIAASQAGDMYDDDMLAEITDAARNAEKAAEAGNAEPLRALEGATPASWPEVERAESGRAWRPRPA